VTGAGPGARLDTAAHWAAAAIAFSLPFCGLAAIDFSALLSAAPSSFAVAAAAPFLLAALLRRRGDLVRSPIFLAVVAVALTRAASNLVALEGVPDLRSAARDALLAVVVGGVGAVTADPNGRRVVERGLVAGGLLAAAISIAGYALSFAAPDGSFLGGFRFASDNNVIGGLPRLTGTSGGQPERMGEYLVLLVAVLLARRARAPGEASAIERLGLPLAIAALALTLSWAWAGGLALAAHALRSRLAGRPPAVRALPIVAAAVAVAAMALAVNLGAPEEGARSSKAPVACESFDYQHDVTVHDPAWGDRCRRVFVTRPYEAPLKLYLEAKRAALALFAGHPLLGVGERRFGELAAAEFAARHGLAATEIAGVYPAPRCLYLGAAAESGILGLAAVLLLVWAVARAGRRIGGPDPDAAAAGWYLAAVVAYLIVGINNDLLHGREIWIALGLLLAAGLRPVSAADR
jgi:hypothetical protein